MQKPARCEPLSQAIEQPLRKHALGRTQRRGIPLRAVHVVDGDERRLASHGEAHVAVEKVAIDRTT